VFVVLSSSADQALVPLACRPQLTLSAVLALYVLLQMQLKLVCALLLVLNGLAAGIVTNPQSADDALAPTPIFPIQIKPGKPHNPPGEAVPAAPVKPHNPPGDAVPAPYNPPDDVDPQGAACTDGACGSLRGSRSMQARSRCTLPHCAQCSSGPLIICTACRPGYSLYKSRCSILIDFDTVTSLSTLTIPYGYKGLNWDHFQVMNPLTFTGVPVLPSGYQLAVVSGKYIGFTGGGYGLITPRSFWAPAGAVFTLNSFSIMAAWNNQLSVLMQGYAADGTMLKEVTLVVDAEGSPVTQTFEWHGINKVTFFPYGGVKVQAYPSIGDHDNVQFAIDNMRITPAV
jgi:hypothetical protein